MMSLLDLLIRIQKIMLQTFGYITARTVRMCKRRYRECAVLVAGGVIVTVALLCAVHFAGGGKNRVYAVQSPETAPEEESEDGTEEFQAALNGILESVESMEQYAGSVSTVRVQNGCEVSLVGPTALERSVVNRRQISREVSSISGVGYYALMEIRNHQMNRNEYRDLTRIVEAEATGGDLKSKLLVANVVLNRVQDSRFPDTIHDVVYQRLGGSCQFSPVEDGRIDSVEVTEDTIRAVDLALEGQDESQGALFFMARQSSDDSNVDWFDRELTPLFAYGGHEYFTFAE